MIFAAEEGWHIKNADQSYLWLEFNYFISSFRMPLLFFISGVGSFFALRKRTGWQYVKERHNRLLIPVIFGMFIIVPPQIYFERIFNGENYTSFFQFYPTVLELVPYPKGNFSWHHLWFVVYLFLYSVIAAPLFLFLRSEKGSKWRERLTFFSTKWGLFTLLIPTVTVRLTLCVWFPISNDLIHDPGYFLYWFTFFITGYLVVCNERIWERIELNRRLSLFLGLVTVITLNVIRWNKMEPWDMEPSQFQEIYKYIFRSFYTISGWFWLLAALGFGRHYLNKPSKLLDYANEGIYPFYILHQTIIIVIGYYVIQVQESIGAKFLFISTLSLILSVAIYDFLIRPFKVTRFLFGMKNK
jgi:hypothetical protein